MYTYPHHSLNTSYCMLATEKRGLKWAYVWLDLEWEKRTKRSMCLIWPWAKPGQGSSVGLLNWEKKSHPYSSAVVINCNLPLHIITLVYWRVYCIIVTHPGLKWLLFVVKHFFTMLKKSFHHTQHVYKVCNPIHLVVFAYQTRAGPVSTEGSWSVMNAVLSTAA